jgi:hypothetical protein
MHGSNNIMCILSSKTGRRALSPTHLFNFILSSLLGTLRWSKRLGASSVYIVHRNALCIRQSSPSIIYRLLLQANIYTIPTSCWLWTRLQLVVTFSNQKSEPHASLPSLGNWFQLMGWTHGEKTSLVYIGGEKRMYGLRWIDLVSILVE